MKTTFIISLQNILFFLQLSFLPSFFLQWICPVLLSKAKPTTVFSEKNTAPSVFSEKSSSLYSLFISILKSLSLKRTNKKNLFLTNNQILPFQLFPCSIKATNDIPRRETSEETNPANTLILTFQLASTIMRKFLLSHPIHGTML